MSGSKIISQVFQLASRSSLMVFQTGVKSATGFNNPLLRGVSNFMTSENQLELVKSGGGGGGLSAQRMLDAIQTKGVGNFMNEMYVHTGMDQIDFEHWATRFVIAPDEGIRFMVEKMQQGGKLTYQQGDTLLQNLGDIVNPVFSSEKQQLLRASANTLYATDLYEGSFRILSQLSDMSKQLGKQGGDLSDAVSQSLEALVKIS
jgi:hypothetical protein